MIKDAGIKGLVIKIGAAAAAVIIASVLFYMNKSLVHRNTKMIKYIKNEAAFKQDLENLKKSEALFSRYIAPIKNSDKAELERIKSGYIDELLRFIETSGLKVDSYRSEIENKDGFVIFKYDITIVGEFVKVIQFFSRLQEEAKYIFAAKYIIERHRETLTRMALTVEIVGLET